MEEGFYTGMRRAGPKVGRLLVKNMRSTKKWKNVSGEANASLNFKIAPLAGSLMVVDLYGTAIHLKWLEGGSIYFGHPSRFESMDPAVKMSASGAVQIVAQEIFG